MNIIKRVKAPTQFSRFWKYWFTLLALSGSLIAAPVVLPTVVVSVAGYLAVTGGVFSAVKSNDS
jgi:hypothetical protein